MGQKKLIRFAEISSFSNVLQFPENMAGNWKDYFGNTNPVVLELACGKGEYALGLGRLHPGKNFIGVDIKGNRIWVGAKKALEEKLQNVAFLRTQIDAISQFFGPGEVAEIWITFPDPQLRLSKAKKRLTHPKFLRLYKQILAPGGCIHLKTDSPDLYLFTKIVTELCQCSIQADEPDVYSMEKLPAELKIRTHYEKLDIAGKKKVHYLRFTLPDILSDTATDDLLKKKLNEHERTDRGTSLLPE